MHRVQGRLNMSAVVNVVRILWSEFGFRLVYGYGTYIFATSTVKLGRLGLDVPYSLLIFLHLSG